MISKKNACSRMKDEELVLAAQAGSFSAEDELIIRFLPCIRSIAAEYYKSHSFYCDSALMDVDDLMQEGSLGLLSAVFTFKAEYNVLFKTYASKCIQNAVSSAVRSRTAKKHTPTGYTVPYEDMDNTLYVDSPEEAVIAVDRCNETLAFLSQSLSNKEYIVLKLYLSGKTYKEIASHTSSEEKSVDNTMQRIRSKLKKFLEANRS